MRLSDAMRPAMEWSEAAMLPARTRTFSEGAALRQLRRVEQLNTAGVQEQKRPVSAEPKEEDRLGTLRRAAFRQVTRLL